MKILAFDTSTQQCSVALYDQGEITDISLLAPHQHAELILSMIDSLLSAASCSLSQIDVIGFGRGPGSFTGLRIAASLAQGLACAWDIPIAPISTLQSLAQAAHQNWSASHVATAMDARMHQLYWATFSLNTIGIMELHTPEVVIDPHTVSLNNNHWLGVGTGWATYVKELHFLQPFLQKIDSSAQPQARTIAFLSHHYHEQKLTLPPEAALPIYLRDKVC